MRFHDYKTNVRVQAATHPLRNRFMILFLSIFCVMGLTHTAVGNFYEKYEDGAYDSYYADKAKSGVGDSDTYYNVGTGILRAYAKALFYGAGSAKAITGIYKKFYYTGNSGSNWIIAKYDWGGELSREYGASCSYRVNLILYDMTDKKEIHRGSIGEELEVEIENTSWNESGTEKQSFKADLVKGHEYKVSLELECNADFTAGKSSADFWNSGYGYKVDIEYFKIWSEDNSITTTGGKFEKTEVQGEFLESQEDCSVADGLKFTNYNKDSDINGWEITIDHFTSAKSDDLDERNIAVEAWNGSVDRGDEVFIEVSHWLDVKNGMGIKNVEWQDEGQCAPLVKAVPDHYWRIGPALPEQQNPGMYKHLFTMVNSDPSHKLKISGLQFLTTMNNIDSLAGISFSGPFHNFEIDQGQSLNLEIITNGSFLGGRIYFKYNVANLDGSETVCNAWGGHEVCEAPSVKWSDNFDSYAAGSQMHGQGGWEGWDGDPQYGAMATDYKSLSSPNSVEIAWGSDLVHEFNGVDSGTWVYSTQVYIPSDVSGESAFIMLSSYDAANILPRVWTVEMYFDPNTDTAKAYCGSNVFVHRDLLYDQWVEVRVEAFLDDDWTKLYFNHQLFDDPALPDHPTLGGGYSWTKGIFGNYNGPLSIMAVDLFANYATPVYYDEHYLAKFGPLDALESDTYQISEATGGSANFILSAGAYNANRQYLILGGISGTSPGFTLPGGMATLPVNYDIFTGMVIAMLNTPVFHNFMGMLDGTGHATAKFDTLGPIPGSAGLSIYYAYALSDPWNFASNAVEIEIVP